MKILVTSSWCWDWKRIFTSKRCWRWKSVTLTSNFSPAHFVSNTFRHQHISSPTHFVSNICRQHRATANKIWKIIYGFWFVVHLQLERSLILWRFYWLASIVILVKVKSSKKHAKRRFHRICLVNKRLPWFVTGSPNIENLCLDHHIPAVSKLKKAIFSILKTGTEFEIWSTGSSSE